VWAVYDDAGKVVALGQLGRGTSSTGLASGCTFPFTVSDVPTGENFY
jgi:hypothetical protein